MKLANGFEVKEGQTVIFKFKFHSQSCTCCKEQVVDGKVVYISQDLACISFLQGFSAMTEDITVDKILAVVDESLQAARVKLENYNGHFILNQSI